MTSFAEFVVKFMDKLGLTLIFSVLLVILLVYMISYSFIKDKIGEKQAKVIAPLVAICIGMLVMAIPNLYRMFVIYSGYIAGTLVLIFFVYLLLKFFGVNVEQIIGKRTELKLVLAVFPIVFIFIAFYFAFEQQLLALGAGEATDLRAKAFRLAVKPEILIIPILFTIMGFAVYILLREEKSGQSS